MKKPSKSKPMEHLETDLAFCIQQIDLINAKLRNLEDILAIATNITHTTRTYTGVFHPDGARMDSATF